MENLKTLLDHLLCGYQIRRTVRLTDGTIFLDKDFPFGITQQDGILYYTELLSQERELVLLGGGHVAQALCHIAKVLDFTVTVVDDREEFVTKERFPSAKRRISIKFEDFFEQNHFANQTFYCILTRGHEWDEVCLEKILRGTFAYCGMIGSRNKVKLTMEHLKEKGMSPEILKKVHSPIGLDIGSITPGEIAVSIAAELIQTLRMQSSEVFSEHMVRICLRGECVLVTVIEKNGSAPRGVGARMVIGEEGIIWGSIGGGRIEAEAINEARDMLHKNQWFTWKEYILDNKEAGGLGMICGGRTKVMFERM